jgi:putative hemolysin
MAFALIVGGLVVAAFGALYFSAATYALRDFSHAKLADYLGKHDGDRYFESLTEKTGDFIFVTAVFRQISNLLIWIGAFTLLEDTQLSHMARYGLSFLLAGGVSVIAAVALPHVLAKYAGEPIIGFTAPVLIGLRTLLLPLTAMQGALDTSVRKIAGVKDEPAPEQIEQEILSAVEEGEKEGVVDDVERQMIESVIEFGDTTAGQIMTARPDIVAVEIGASLEQVRSLVETSGHSRIPVYEDSLDKILGVLYARDLIKALGLPPEKFDMRMAMRPAMTVPETKRLRDLLEEFRVKKVHLAVVVDEYGGTAGLVTIEDVLEELVGEISDEHEPQEPAMLRKITEQVAEADARVPVSELNAQLGLSIPEDTGYETLGGFLSTCLGRIPPVGATYEQDGTRFVVLDAEPQRVHRVRIELPVPKQAESSHANVETSGLNAVQPEKSAQSETVAAQK